MFCMHFDIKFTEIEADLLNFVLVDTVCYFQFSAPFMWSTPRKMRIPGSAFDGCAIIPRTSLKASLRSSIKHVKVIKVDKSHNIRFALQNFQF